MKCTFCTSGMRSYRESSLIEYFCDHGSAVGRACIKLVFTNENTYKIIQYHLQFKKNNEIFALSGHCDDNTMLCKLMFKKFGNTDIWIGDEKISQIDYHELSPNDTHLSAEKLFNTLLIYS